MPACNILYSNDDLDIIKNMDPGFNAIEDYIKTPDEDMFVIPYLLNFYI